MADFIQPLLIAAAHKIADFTMHASQLNPLEISMLLHQDENSNQSMSTAANVWEQMVDNLNSLIEEYKKVIAGLRAGPWSSTTVQAITEKIDAYRT